MNDQQTQTSPQGQRKQDIGIITYLTSHQNPSHPNEFKIRENGLWLAPFELTFFIIGGEIMTKEEHTQAIQDIRKLVNDDDGKITELLTNLSDDYGKILAENSDFQLKNEKLKNDNEKLRDTNMRLFLKVGSPKEESEEKPLEEAKEEKKEEEEE